MSGRFIKHISCEECGSSDNMAIYRQEDDKITGSCFGCKHYIKDIDENGNKLKEGQPLLTKEQEEYMSEFKTEAKVDLGAVKALPSKGLAERKIYGPVARFYEMRVGYMGEGPEITHHFYPYTKDGEIVGYQKRDVANKRFSAVGYGKSDIELQGQHLWPNGHGKHLVITEGFLDALSVSQVLSGKEEMESRYPVVSLPAGANTSCIVHNTAWINSFDRVVLMFDQDEVGQKAAVEVAEMLDPGKVRIAKFSEKDPSDMLVQDKDKELYSAFWQAPMHSPADIVTSADAVSILKQKKDEPCFPLPSFISKLDEMMYGIRMGEITLLTSGTGSGKTQVARELNYSLLMETEHKIGIVSLEESTADVFEGLLSLHMERRVHLPDIREAVGEALYFEAAKELFTEKPDRLMVLDHQGSSADDDLLSRIKFLINSGCKFITVDHITVAISEAGDTNKAIDTFMNRLLKLAKQHSVHFAVVSHLRKVGQGQKNFEEGAVPTLDDMKGSGSIKQIANNVIAFSRNRMDEDPVKQNTTQVHLLKCRYSGAAGYAGSFHFDNGTGRLSEAVVLAEDSQTNELPQEDKPLDDNSFTIKGDK